MVAVTAVVSRAAAVMVGVRAGAKAVGVKEVEMGVVEVDGGRREVVAAMVGSQVEVGRAHR